MGNANAYVINLMSKNKKIKIFFFFLLLFLLLPFTFPGVETKDLGVNPVRSIVSNGAGFVYALEINYPRIPGFIPPQDFINNPSEDILSLYIKYIFNLALWLGGIIALGGLIYGGIRYLISTGKPEAIISAREQITAAFFGLLILLSSYLILNTISPQFTGLKLEKPSAIQIPETTIGPPPPVERINTSIDVEMPFGRIIDKLFETYISDYPAPQQTETPRMERIENDVRAIISEQNSGIADNLKSQSENLKTEANNCRCNLIRPDPPCNHPGCGDCPPRYCTCDPCKNVRNNIQENEDKNKEEINNLTAKNIEIEEEVRLLEEELDRLKRAEKFIEECRLRSLTSLAQFYSKKNSFDKQKWILRETNFWDDASIVYYTGERTTNDYGNWYFAPTKEIANDFATFYCALGGTLEEAPFYPSFAPDQGSINDEMSPEEVEDVMSEAMACSDEAPVGEIIDRAERVAQLLIDKLGQLVGKDKELINAVDKLQVLVSQCSSRRCTPSCYCTGGKHPYCVEIGCLGIPCPLPEINDQLNKIQKIWEEIRDIIEGKGNNDTPTDIGILPIIKEIAPEILKDLEEKVRIPMKKCSSSNWLEQDKALFNCRQIKEATVPPENQTVKDCYPIKNWGDQGEETQTEYGDCYEECYLKKGIVEHRKCVQQCLDEKAQQLGDEDIAHCANQLNFYCCQAGG